MSLTVSAETQSQPETTPDHKTRSLSIEGETYKVLAWSVEEREQALQEAKRMEGLKGEEFISAYKGFLMHNLQIGEEQLKRLDGLVYDKLALEIVKANVTLPKEPLPQSTATSSVATTGS